MGRSEQSLKGIGTAWIRPEQLDRPCWTVGPQNQTDMYCTVQFNSNLAISARFTAHMPVHSVLLFMPHYCVRNITDCFVLG